MDRQKPPSDFRMSLFGLPYDQTIADRPPIPISTPSSEPSAEQLRAYETVSPTLLSAKSKLHLGKVARHDSGLASSSARDSRTTFTSKDHSAASVRSTSSIPQIRVDHETIAVPPSRRTEKSWLSLKPTKSITRTAPPDNSFRGITLDLPTGGLVDDLQPEQIRFTKRGSMLLRGRKVTEPQKSFQNSLQPAPEGRRVKSSPSLRNGCAQKVLSADEEWQSYKVRSYYEIGMPNTDDLEGMVFFKHQRNGQWQEASLGLEGASRQTSTSDMRSDRSASVHTSEVPQDRPFLKEELELAGGLEDWQDVENGDVDRYGFIMPRTATTGSAHSGDVKGSSSMREPPTLQRVSTSLQLAADTPRRKYTIRRAPSNANSAKPVNAPPRSTPPPIIKLMRPVSSQSSYQGSLAGGSSRLRQAANRLPHNRDRRFVDEAGDMLTLPFGRADNADSGGPEAKEAYMKRKEIEREEKWRKMARIVSKRPDGRGTLFDFDTDSPKVIERTWKGIPDRWRATAWHAFLSASAKKSMDCLSDEELMEAFHGHQTQASPDDVQIDIDVPRTISSHIMFRRRYRGGQRLLFRVLHAMSLHFPSTGYVQGMAAIAATLLAYYDEEKAFLMLVRLWELRGLGRLYQSGFGGLMEALDDFEKQWLGGGEISAKLVSGRQLKPSLPLTR